MSDLGGQVGLHHHKLMLAGEAADSGLLSIPHAFDELSTMQWPVPQMAVLEMAEK